jgi:D-glycero-alpha-D-manno-heptose-7-phosphate kinase
MIVVQTPLRISFVGGGTDFEGFYAKYGGAVLTTAIDKVIFVIIKERFDDLICLNYTLREKVEKVQNIRHELIREAMKMTGITKGVEITTLADIPAEGTGLGSSSSVTVGLLQAMYTYQNEIKTAQDLAEQACKIEIDILKKPIGKQDQVIAACGNLRFITFSATGISIETIELPKQDKRRLNENLLSFYTGITRKASDILDEQKNNINEKIDILKEMKYLAFKARDAVEAGAFDDFGEILHKNWELKKSLASKISNSQIDDMYETARKAGAIGGKITGAGGGGFLLLYCPKAKQDDVRNAMKLRELPFRFEEYGSKVIFNYRRVC